VYSFRLVDTISPKLFTALLEYRYVQKNRLAKHGGKYKWRRPNHLRFADDIVLISDSVDKARKILEHLHRTSSTVGLKINTSKTQFITNLVVSDNIHVGVHNIEQVTKYKYLGHEVRSGRDNQTAEICRRVSLPTLG